MNFDNARKAIGFASALVGLMLQSSLAGALDWPNRSVRLLVPYPPGGNVDVVGRVVAHALQADLGQPFVIENKGGAGGLIAGEIAAKSPPDGYTFFLSANGPILYAPELVPTKPYDWRTDFVPVGTSALTSLALVVNPSLPVRTLPEFIDFAHREGEKLVFATAGMGASNHLFSELMQAEFKAKWTTAHYRGTTPAMADVVAGHVHFSVDQISASLPLIRDERVRAIAASGEKRAKALPDLPTFTELGYSRLQGYTFVGFMAPAGTPDEIVRKMSEALKRASRDPQVIQQITTLGAEPEAMSAEEFRAYLEKETTVWLPVVRGLNKPH